MNRSTATAAAQRAPDVNALTHPFAVVQSHLDRAEWLNLYATPVPGHPRDAWLVADRKDYFGIDGGYGLSVASHLHRFDSRVMPPRDGRLRVAQAVGKRLGELRGRFLFTPHGADWTPGREPPPGLYDPWRPQSFAMLDVEVRLGHGDDGFRGYGLGHTRPVSVDGEPWVLAGGVGTVTSGHGRLAGLDATFVLNGAFHDLGFEGSVTCRVVDPEGRLRASGDPPARGGTAATPRSTFLLLRGEKEGPEVRTEYGPPPAPGLVSLVTPARMRAVEHCTAVGDPGGLRSHTQTGQVAADLLARVALDIAAPPGTAERPNAFTTRNLYTFRDGAGGEAGAVEAAVELGRSFDLRFPGLPDQPAMRYGGIGPVLGGRGRFAGAVGMLAVNSAIGIAPHALSMLNVIQIPDPAGRLRVGGGS